MLKDIKAVKPASLRKTVESLVALWFNEQGTEEQQKEIKEFAKKNNLEFLLPSDWFEDYVKVESHLDKADKDNEETSENEENVEKEKTGEEATDTINPERIVFKFVTNKETAEVVREFFGFLKDLDVNDKDNEASIDFVVNGKKLQSSIDVVASSIKVFDSQEDYERQEEQEEMQKASAIKVVFTHQDSAQNLEDILNAINNHDHFIIDPENDDSHFDVSGINDLNYSFGEDSVSITGNVKDLMPILEAIAACGNGGHSFSIVADGEEVAYWDGDGHDYIKSVSLEKAEITSNYSTLQVDGVFEESYTPVRNLVASLQESLVPYGAIVNYISKSIVLIQFQKDISAFVQRVLDDSEISHLVKEAFVDKNDIYSVFVDFAPILVVEKAKKGSRGYEEWLRKYREKRSKNKTDEKREKQVSSGEDDLVQQIENLRQILGNRSQVEVVQAALRALEREEAIERMLSAQPRDNKGRYTKREY